MKKCLLALFTAATILPAHAQLFSPEALTGAVLGGVAGGIIGHNNGRKTAEGAGIGAGVGLLAGALVHNQRELNSHGYSHHTPSYSIYHSRPNYAWSGAALGGIAGGIIGHNNGGRTWEGIGIGAGAGLLMGGLLEQRARLHEGRHYSPGYGWGYRSHYHHAPVYRPYYATTYVPVAPVVISAPAPAPTIVNTPAPQVTIINNNYYGTPTPMSSANAMFGR